MSLSVLNDTFNNTLQTIETALEILNVTLEGLNSILDFYVKDNKNKMQKEMIKTIDGDMYMELGDIKELQKYLKEDLFDLAAVERITGISVGDLELMIGQCNSRNDIPADAQVRSIRVQGKFLVQKKYIENFKERYDAFKNYIEENPYEVFDEDLELRQEYQKKEETPSEPEEIEDEEETVIYEEYGEDEETKKKNDQKKKKQQQKRKDELKRAEDARKTDDANSKQHENTSADYKETSSDERTEQPIASETVQKTVPVTATVDIHENSASASVSPSPSYSQEERAKSEERLKSEQAKKEEEYRDEQKKLEEQKRIHQEKIKEYGSQVYGDGDAQNKYEEQNRIDKRNADRKKYEEKQKADQEKVNEEGKLREDREKASRVREESKSPTTSYNDSEGDKDGLGTSKHTNMPTNNKPPYGASQGHYREPISGNAPYTPPQTEKTSIQSKYKRMVLTDEDKTIISEMKQGTASQEPTSTPISYSPAPKANEGPHITFIGTFKELSDQGKLDLNKVKIADCLNKTKTDIPMPMFSMAQATYRSITEPRENNTNTTKDSKAFSAYKEYNLSHSAEHQWRAKADADIILHNNYRVDRDGYIIAKEDGRFYKFSKDDLKEFTDKINFSKTTGRVPEFDGKKIRLVDFEQEDTSFADTDKAYNEISGTNFYISTFGKEYVKKESKIKGASSAIGNLVKKTADMSMRNNDVGYGIKEVNEVTHVILDISGLNSGTDGDKYNISKKAAKMATGKYENNIGRAIFKAQKINTRVQFERVNKILEKNGIKEKLDVTNGLEVKKRPVNIGSNEFRMITNGRKDIHNISTSDFAKMSEHASGTLKKEISLNNKVNEYLRKNNLDFSKMDASEIAFAIGNVKDKNIKKILMDRTGNGGFQSQLRYDHTRSQGKRKVFTNDVLTNNRKLINTYLEKRGLGRLKTLNNKQLKEFIHSKLALAEDREVVAALIMLNEVEGTAQHTLGRKIKSIQQLLFRQLVRNRNWTAMGLQDIKTLANDTKQVVRLLQQIKRLVVFPIKLQRRHVVKTYYSPATKAKLTPEKFKKLEKKAKKINKQLERQSPISRLKDKQNKLKKKIKDKTVNRVKTKLSKVGAKFASTKTGKALGMLAKPFKQLKHLFKKIMEMLKALLHYFFIIVGAVGLAILLINVFMYLTGTIGETITSFFTGEKDIMETEAQRVLADLQAKDIYMFDLIDKCGEEKKLSDIGLSNLYSFVDANTGKRYSLNFTGVPYGNDGYEQHYYNGQGQEIGRYSNAKDLLSVTYAAFGGTTNLWDRIINRYQNYNSDLWAATHVCATCGEKMGSVTIQSLYSSLHSHATQVYACENGDCDGDGTPNTYTYYCNTQSSSATSTQKATQWVYNTNLWNYSIHVTPYAQNNSENPYLCVIYGDGKNYAGKLVPSGKGCVHVTHRNYTASESASYGVQKINTAITLNGQSYSKDKNGNTIGYYVPVTVSGGKITETCNNYTVKYCTSKYGCKNPYYIQHSNNEVNGGKCGDKIYCSNASHKGIDNKNYQHYMKNACANSQTYNLSSPCTPKQITKTVYIKNQILSFTFWTQRKITYTEYTCNKKNNLMVLKDNLGNTAYTKINGSPIQYYAGCAGHTETVYVCLGHCKGHTVCGGETVCAGHDRCNGHKMTYCTGHVNAYTTMQILDIHSGATEKALELSGNSFNLSSIQEYAEAVYNKDWYELYHVNFRNDKLTGIIQEQEQIEILSYIQPGTDEKKTPVYEFAKNVLLSIGRIPYYEKSVDYIDQIQKYSNPDDFFRQFTKKVESDDNGRTVLGCNDFTYVPIMLYNNNLIKQKAKSLNQVSLLLDSKAYSLEEQTPQTGDALFNQKGGAIVVAVDGDKIFIAVENEKTMNATIQEITTATAKKLYSNAFHLF